MRTKNDITGDALVTKPSSDAYRDGWDRIFGKKETEKPVEAEATNEPCPLSTAEIDALSVPKPKKPK